jgi:ABC-type multidrug transport system ATPase subunit
VSSDHPTEDVSETAATASAVTTGRPEIATSGERIRIGRDADNEVVLSDLQVSRHHTEIRRAGDTFQVVDLGSRNGTYLNGRLVQRPSVVHAGDVISIGRHELLFDGHRLHDHVDTGPASLIADDLTVRVGDKVLLDDVSFALAEGSLLGVIGPSGCGKSTLVKALTGLRPATQGRIWYGGRDLYADFSQLRYRLGMVPQDDVLHTRLKVRTALRFAAALRFADDVPRKVRWAKVNEVMQTMRLTERAKTRIDQLSGGQRKRASVAMELLTEPSLFCLDEPTSGLDPSLDKEVMAELRELADKGKTVIVVTHSVLHLNYCDRVLVMCYGGTMGYFGPPDQLLNFFDADDYAEVFSKITDEPERWTRAFRNSPLYARYVSAVNPTERSAARPAKVFAELADGEAAVDAESTSDSPNGHIDEHAGTHHHDAPRSVTVPAQRSGQLDDEPTLQAIPTGPLPTPEKIQPGPSLARMRPDAPHAKSGTANMDAFGWRLLLKRLFARDPRAPFRQYLTLCHRMIRVILADRGFSAFLVATPIILAVLAYTVPGDKGLAFTKSGDIQQGIAAMQLLVVLVTGSTFLGIAAAIREIVNEAVIYSRERAVGLSVAAYVSSKLTVFFLINVGQVALFAYLALFEGPPSRSLVLPSQTVEVIVEMAAIALVCTVLGLLISALAKTTEQTTPIMVVTVMAMLVFSGGLFQLQDNRIMEIIAWFFPTRWGFAAAAETTNIKDMVGAAFPDPLFAHDVHLWWRSIIFLAIQFAALVGLTRLALKRHEPGRS